MEILKQIYMPEYDLVVFANGEVFKGNGKKVSSRPDRHGYHRVFFRRVDGTRGNIGLHRLVAIAFIDNPEKKSDVNHKDANKSNNTIDNLEWMTRKENMAHAKSLNLLTGPKKRVDVAIKKKIIRHAYESMDITQHEIALAFGISSERVSNIINEQELA